MVTAANMEDSDGAKILMGEYPELIEGLKKLWADQKYRGSFKEWVWEEYRIELEVVERADGQVGFVVLPRRRVVERSIGWYMRWRRLSKDYECMTMCREAGIYIAAVGLGLQRVAPNVRREKPYGR